MFTVISFEYLRTIKKPSFWLTTLLLPVFIAFVGGISAMSSLQTEKNLEKAAQEIASIHLVDPAGVFSAEEVTEPFVLKTDAEASIAAVRQGSLSAVVILEPDFVDSQQYTLYAQDKGLLSNSGYTSRFERFVRTTMENRIASDEVRSLLNASFSASMHYLDDEGQPVSFGVEAFLLPGIAFVLFFLGVFMGAQHLLQSVSEEKENRMIETMLSVIPPTTLIFGKIVGLSLVVLTQIAIWTSAAVGLFFASQQHAVLAAVVEKDSLGEVFTFFNIATILLLTFLGFLFFASLMVGVGAVGTSARESQSLSSFFVISAVLPIYFITTILSDPSGVLATVFSYFPTTSAFVLMIRHAIGALEVWELLLGLVVNVLFVVVGMWLAVKCFLLGMLLYNRRPTWKELAAVLLKR